MNSMKEAIEAIDKYIHKSLCYPRGCYCHYVELLTDNVGRIYTQSQCDDIKCIEEDMSLVDLIDARNYLVYGKARKINTSNSR